MVLFSLMFATLVSEDLACLAAGVLIREGRMSAAACAGACAAGIVIGDFGLWSAGRALRALARRWTAARRWMERLPLDDLGRRLENRAATTILASRFLPGSRLPLYLGAGLLAARQVVPSALEHQVLGVPEAQLSRLRSQRALIATEALAALESASEAELARFFDPELEDPLLPRGSGPFIADQIFQGLVLASGSAERPLWLPPAEFVPLARKRLTEIAHGR